VRADAVPVPVAGGRTLRTLRGTLDQVVAEGEQAPDAYLRVILAEAGRAGLGDLVRDKLPNALEVMLDEAHRPRPGSAGGDRPSRIGRSPAELFGDYLREQNIDDPRINAMFADLLDEVTAATGEPESGQLADAPAAVAGDA
jgi:exonuclease SbcD